MADNYIERKMEDLRNSMVSKVSHVGPTVRRKGGLNFPFPPKRILIASDTPWLEAIIELFRKADCKVAVISANKEKGEVLASAAGIRMYPVIPFSCNEERSIENSFLSDCLKKYCRDLFKAWRDIDILIADQHVARLITEEWWEWRTSYPYVSDYICRIIVLGDADPEDFSDLCSPLLKSTVNVINCNDDSPDITPLVGMLSVPGNSIVDGMKFFIR